MKKIIVWAGVIAVAIGMSLTMLASPVGAAPGDGTPDNINGDSIDESLAVAKDAVLENMAGVVLAAATGIAIVLALVFIAVYWGRFKSFLIGLIRR